LSKEELKDYKNVEIFMKEYYKWKDYFSFIRQSIWNKSIKHLHYHYLIWKVWYKELNWNKFLKIK
jgi:hypothetical protein